MSSLLEKSVDRYLPREGGVYSPPDAVLHRDEEYDARTFSLLREMQAKHFWYRGRHRFLRAAFEQAVKTNIPAEKLSTEGLQAIDLGGGCGGWIEYLLRHSTKPFAELALADSSLDALRLAGNVVGPDVTRYQIDLLNLQWSERWDVAFLLDVLEHIPDHTTALRQIYESLRPGGLLMITTPALQRLWTYNDELVHHVRRYSRADYAQLARECGFELIRSRYFMFFLSPLLLASRWKSPDLAKMSDAEKRLLLERTHRVPGPLVNGVLGTIFGLETPLGLSLPFPWGTSILAILRRPVA